MISGDYRNYRKIWQEDTVKVEKSHQSSDKQDEDTITIDIDIDEDSESDTEESFFFNEDSETFSWVDEEPTINADGSVEITLKRVVKTNITGYNKEGKLREVKIRPRTIKII